MTLTIAELRDFLTDLDGDGPVVVQRRCDADPDLFHAPVTIDDVHADTTFGAILVLEEVGCTGDDDHPDPLP